MKKLNAYIRDIQGNVSVTKVDHDTQKIIDLIKNHNGTAKTLWLFNEDGKPEIEIMDSKTVFYCRDKEILNRILLPMMLGA